MKRHFILLALAALAPLAAGDADLDAPRERGDTF